MSSVWLGSSSRQLQQPRSEHTQYLRLCLWRSALRGADLCGFWGSGNHKQFVSQLWLTLAVCLRSQLEGLEAQFCQGVFSEAEAEAEAEAKLKRKRKRKRTLWHIELRSYVGSCIEL